MATKPIKSPVTKRALVQRINRKLAATGEKLIATRGEIAQSELGDFYRVNAHGTITSKNDEPEKVGRELGVLKPYEVLRTED
jgi:hypothetical protein